MVPSPCTKVCEINEKLCLGCYRKIEEITSWGQLTNVEKQKVLLEIEQRKQNVGKHKME